MAFFILLDQISKFLIIRLGFKVFENPFFAFSINLNIVLMYAIYFIVIALVIYYLYSVWNSLSHVEYVAWAVISAGGTSNLVERIIRGSVRDFITVLNGVLNLADLFIIIGVFTIIIYSYFRTQRNKSVV